MANPRRHLPVLALATLALAVLLVPAGSAHARRLQQDAACPEPGTVTLTTTALAGSNPGWVDAGDLENPYRIVSGCDYAVAIPHGEGDDAVVAGDTEAIHLVLDRAGADNTRLVWNWEFLDETPVAFFSWFDPPVFTDDGEEYDWYKWPAAAVDETMWNPDREEQRDIYHMKKGGGAFQDTPHTGDLFITISSKLANAEVDGTVRFEFEVPKPFIQPDQLAALKDLYDSCCAPTQQTMAAGWTWRDHTEQVSNDLDFKPHCDWLFQGWNGTEFRGGWQDFGEQDCERIDDVMCDADGNVVELSVGGKGLKCDALPESLSALDKIEKLHMGSNQIKGPVPALVAESTTLEEFDVAHNFLEGEIPCPASPVLKEYFVSYNYLTGEIPECIGDIATLQYFGAQSNELGGDLPASLGRLASLVSLNLEQNRFTSGIPDAWKGMEKLSSLKLARNALEGFIDDAVINAMSKLYSLDLSFNHFIGTLPTFGPALRSLRHINLSYNNLGGDIKDQFVHFQKFQDEEAASSLNLMGNDLSGELPKVLYDLVAGAQRINGLAVAGNKFRCDTETGTWPEWALRLTLSSDVLGACTPVPVVASVEPPTAPAGAELVVKGKDFAPSSHLRCKFGDTVVPAPYVNRETVLCQVPDNLAAGEAVTLTVANYGADWSSPATVEGYAPVTFTREAGAVQAQAESSQYCFLDF